MLRLLTAIIVGVSALSYSQTWVTSFELGVEIAKKYNKEILLYFYEEHCPYCVQMEEFVLGDPEVDRFIKERFVVVSVDMEKSRELNKKFMVIGTPYFVVYDPIADRILLKIFGSREKEDFLNLLSGACKKSYLRRC